MTEEELRKLYAQPSPRSEKAIAIAEREMWADFLHESRSSGAPLQNRREWFQEKFGITCIESDRRSRILKRGALADPIWGLMEIGRVGMDAACNALLRAERSSDPEGVIREFCEEKIRPQEGFHEVKTASGKVMVRRLPRKASFTEPMEEFDASTAKKATKAIMELAEKFLESRLENLEDYGMRRTVADEFKFAIRVACDDLVKGTSKIRAHGHVATHARRVSIRESFEVLGISPPRKKVSDEDRARAQAAYRKLAKTYHPDRNPGDEVALGQYRAVNNAWSAIQDHKE